MKPTRLSSLPLDQQERIHSLCQDYTYQQVVPILARPPSQGGLGLKTSKSALCRFILKYNSASEQAEALGQLAHAVLLRSQPAGQEVMAAIVSILQQQIFLRLTQGVELKTLFPLFRHLQRFHRDLFAIEKWHTRNPGTLREDYEQFASSLTQEQDTDDCETIDPATPATQTASSAPENPVSDSTLCPAIPTENPRNPTNPTYSTPLPNSISTASHLPEEIPIPLAPPFAKRPPIKPDLLLKERSL